MFPTYPDLRGRTALVTGASSGIGRGIASAFLEQGMRVAAQHKTQPPPDGCAPVRAEMGTEAGCVEAVKASAAALGRVDVLVHSAGIYNPGPIATISAQAIEEMFRVNTFSAFYLVRELLQHGLNTVVFVGSTAGQRGEAGHSHYAASKTWSLRAGCARRWPRNR